MKIDIHTHTRKCKSGDAPTREITPEKFCEKILATEVRIIAITNHNVFDLDQFKIITSSLGNEVQVWPGVELDIYEDGSRGHLIVIVSPSYADEFSELVKTITQDDTPDDFTTTIDAVLEKFDTLNPLYVAHYKQKLPNLSDGLLDKLVEETKNPSNVIKEVTNSISAGIYISHGHASIYGSDVHDWEKYEQQSNDLPDLRLPVDSFEHFCLLLKKDATTINTVLDRKTSEDLELTPFDDDTTLTIKAYNDINIIFGPKGTGKSCILKAIEKHYTESGVDACVYTSASDRLDEIFDTKGKDLQVNLNNYDINYCSDEIEEIREANEIDITNISKYVAYFTEKITNRNAKKILLKDMEPEEESVVRREFVEFNQAVQTTSKFLEFLESNLSVKKELSDDEHEQLTELLSNLLNRLGKREWNSFSIWKEISLLNSAIELFRLEIERKTGTPAKPTNTGFHDYAMNRVNVELNTSEIINNVNTKIPIIKESVGSLGLNKGNLEFWTEFVFQTGSIPADSTLHSFTAAKKTTQKKFMNCIKKIHQHIYTDNLFQYISDLNEIDGIEDIKTINELLQFRRHFALEGQKYIPSSGESSMVMLQKELGTDKDVYILDEPERSLGNEYINDVIVPLIKERARSGKKVFISTHDANIAVRTLPYSSIYRCHEKSGYSTYIGNPFTNNLVNPVDETDQLDWKKISMKTLEGGEEAFGERGTIYGKN